MQRSPTVKENGDGVQLQDVLAGQGSLSGHLRGTPREGPNARRSDDQIAGRVQGGDMDAPLIADTGLDQDHPGGKADGSISPRPVNQSPEEVQDGGGAGEDTDTKKREKRKAVIEEIHQLFLNWQDKIHDTMKFIAVALTVLISITFTGFLNPPRGVDPDDGEHTNYVAIILFIIFDSTSFVLAVGALHITLVITLTGLTVFRPTQFSVKRTNISLEVQESLTQALISSVYEMVTSLRHVFLLFYLAMYLCLCAFEISGFLINHFLIGQITFYVVFVIESVVIGTLIASKWTTSLAPWRQEQFDLTQLADSILEAEQSGTQ